MKNKYIKYYNFIEKLKSDNHNPYRDFTQPSTKEYTFNQLAYYIEEDYSLLKNNADTRKIIYPLLDRVMSNGDFMVIIEKVLSLDDEKAKKFKELLDSTDLPNIIKFTTEVADKQRFLDFLYKIIYDDIGQYLKERSQLHKIIEKELWIFGDEYTNTPVMFSDKNLENSLNKLRNTYFNYEPAKEDDNLIDGKHKEISDITDLLIYNEKTLSNDWREILIIELKSPKTKISQKELNQVARYKYDIETLGEFSKLNTKYKIILVSSDITPMAKSQIGTDKKLPTLYQASNAGYDIEIHVINWSEIIANRKKHLNYLSNYLETKDIDMQNIFKTQYPELDISNLQISTKKGKK